METEIKGGKLYLNGKQVELVNNGSVLIGENIVCSAGILYVNGECVRQFSKEQFNELKSGAN